jgi:pyroglutamyl-peptidase
MKIMITGFGRFLSNEKNPTKEVLRILPKSIYGNTIKCVELPVIFDECFDYLRPIIEEFMPDAIIMLGLSGGRTAITPERVALNIKDARLPDNIGYKPVDEVINPRGKNAYFSTLPLRKIEEKLTEKHIPVKISNTAGLYVCNNIMYHVLNFIDQRDFSMKAGFIHVPYMDEDKPKEDVFSLPLDIIVESVIDIIKTVL